jgi:2-methylcitrate dehydratase PrpD
MRSSARLRLCGAPFLFDFSKEQQMIAAFELALWPPADETGARRDEKRGVAMLKTGLSAMLSRFLAAAPQTGLSAGAIEAAKRAFIDTIGVMLAGRLEPAVTIMKGCLPQGNEAYALLGERCLSARDAALLNGVAAHVLDYDDVAGHGHPSVVLVPAILAEAQRLDANGMDALRAYVIGFEVWAELGSREPDAYHLRSWHPTAMIGTIAATSAVAALNRLNEHEAGQALAIAASLASGVIANFGSHMKAIQVGRAAANGIEAVHLAQAGVCGAADALESPHGLLHGISPRNRVDTETPARVLDAPGRLPELGLCVKRYPVCYASHRAIDGVIELVNGANLSADDVKSVTVGLGVAPAHTLKYAQPRTGLEAKFSLHHNVAAALLDRQVGFAQLTDDYVRRPDVSRLFEKTTMQVLNDESPEQPGMATLDWVVIETVDGRRLDSGGIRYARGHARLPLSDEELDDKFLDCARHAHARGGADLLRKLRQMERMNHLRDLRI